MKAFAVLLLATFLLLAPSAFAIPGDGGCQRYLIRHFAYWVLFSDGSEIYREGDEYASDCNPDPIYIFTHVEALCPNGPLDPCMARGALL